MPMTQFLISYMEPYNKLTKEEKRACVFLYPDEAKGNEDRHIRKEAYRALGYTEEAKVDEDICIRREAELYFNVLNR